MGTPGGPRTKGGPGKGSAGGGTGIAAPGEQGEGAPRRQAVEFDHAISYVHKIKTRFSKQESVYKGFLEILNMYRRGTNNIVEVYREVRTAVTCALRCVTWDITSPASCDFLSGACDRVPM